MYLPLLHQRLCDQLGKPSLEGFACQLDVWWCLPGITQHDVSRWSQRMPCDDKEPGDTWLIIALYKFLWTAVCDLCHSFSLNGSWLLQPVPRFEMLRGMWTMRAWTSTCPHQRRPTSSWHLSWAPKYVYIYYIYKRWNICGREGHVLQAGPICLVLPVQAAERRGLRLQAKSFFARQGKKSRAFCETCRTPSRIISNSPTGLCFWGNACNSDRGAENELVHACSIFSCSFRNS